MRKTTWKAKYEMLKDKIGDYDEDDVIGKDKFSAELPEDLKTYVEHSDIMSMLNYVGVPPDKKRLEAGHPGLSYKTMLHIAALSGQKGDERSSSAWGKCERTRLGTGYLV